MPFKRKAETRMTPTKVFLIPLLCSHCKQQIIYVTYNAQIMKEADLDKDNQLSLAEFEHVLSKSPDFMT